MIASTLAEADRLLSEGAGWFPVLTGLVLADGDRDAVVEFFLKRDLPTVVVSGVYDEDLRKRVLQQQIIDYVLKNTPAASITGVAGAAAGTQPPHRRAGGGRFAVCAWLRCGPAAHVRP